MRQSALVSFLVVVVLSAASVGAFAPSTPAARPVSSASSRTVPTLSTLHMFGEGGDEPPKLTRDSEPEDYFATNMDKMSDSEKLPIALAGLAFISLPFIAGLIALYASK
mmetsp:Transcript_39286/g.80485  ORF Transcript_39286/g.80485 Transcript_39286/m.80485 type:complete len:109 (+) Transcript_39286:133-459(+)|eukprot:CAMPEP_0178547784 /NCGR_PEP_ID=MMETSP0697-20121206/4859_1 /TAXON_ID=265572 /ORGANISM="Extubocellulus spinifer, Strain CCMP396" /LENGTH=108 /DNA_ID=CAMNT_0020180439 /DNA_START=14 /DNA_END=340 /DNA_ORIENTATION=+